MKKLCEHLEPFIEERIKDNIIKLKTSKEYGEMYKNFQKLYNQVFEVETNNTGQIEELFDIYNTITSKEIFLAYQTGFIDGIKLDDYLEEESF